MTPNEFYQKMTMIDNESIMTMPQVPIAVNRFDGIAADLMLWIENKYPDLTQGELEYVLDCAKFWAVFWAAAWKAK